MKFFVILLCFTLAIAENVKNNANPEVHSPSGVFKGSILKSQSGKDILSFRGIRYADAPTGSNRFKQATPVERLNEIFDATNDGPACLQPNAESQVTSEDCLRLNVYTTALPQNSSKPNRPVIVFIHPGALATSSGSSNELGPQFVLEQNVVFVTLNYRLGALGFLSTGDKRAPGNAGLKDQVLALRWVQQNIKSFGGNPNSVTLMGHCVGSMSVLLHIVSPLSKGLFHRALAMSGYASKDPLPNDQKDLSLKQAELIGCPIDKPDNMFNCLYEKSPELFANSYSKLAASFGDGVIWSPVIEPMYNESNGDEKPFLTGQPADLIREGKAHFVPLMIGANVDEFGSAVIRAEEQAQSDNTTLYDEWNNKWEELAPRRFDYESGTPRSLRISRELRSFYLNDKPLIAGRYQGLAKLYADSLTFFQVHRFERLMATYSPYPVWYYQHSYESCDTHKRWSNGTRFGIVHFDELYLLFKIRDRPAHCEKDLPRVAEIWELIANYAEIGNPIPINKADKYCFTWQPSTKNQPQYLEYKGEEKRMVSGIIYQERMNKWDELYPFE